MSQSNANLLEYLTRWRMYRSPVLNVFPVVCCRVHDGCDSHAFLLRSELQSSMLCRRPQTKCRSMRDIAVRNKPNSGEGAP